MNLSDNLAERLKSVSQTGIAEELREKRRETDLDWAHRMAAAVLSHFNPRKLRPYGVSTPNDPGAYMMRLLQDCLPAGENGSEWMLKHPVRKAALARLKTEQALKEALDGYPSRPDDLLQDTISACIGNTLEPIERQSLPQLQHTHQVVDWLSGTDIAARLPDTNAVGRLIEWRQLLEPFSYLAGDHFRGRVQELADLHAYVFEGTGPAPLLIFGPGGAGKSTLLAKFIQDATSSASIEDRIPFTYIDFDRLVATPEEPLTLLMEAASQLAIQYPHIEDQAGYFGEEWSYRLTAVDARSIQTEIAQKIDYSAFSKTSSRSLRSRLDIRSGYINDFAQLLMAAGAPPHKPFLLVLDTFEEVQFRSRDQVRELSYFFDELRSAIPHLRILIAGRGLIAETEMNVAEMELQEFDESASVGFLTFKGIESEVLAKEIFRLVGGNPLSLKLAADLVLNEGLNLGQQAGFEELKAVLRRVEENNIQGQLYRRILEHIKNPEARKLAHPGLALRYLTADLIRDVLAGPCGLDVTEDVEAHRLFEILRNEVSLVTPDPHRPDVLRHRPDVRAVMIQALQNDEPLVVHEIHRGAVRYYEQFDDPESRAEEIYHRLFSEGDFSRVDERWESGWEEPLYVTLRPALTEFPPAAQAWLAGRLGVSGVAIDWNETDLRDWERLVRKRIDDMIYGGRFEEAYQLISARRERTIGSPLYYYETLILIQQKRWDEARRCVKEGLYSMRQAHDDGQLLTLLKQAIQIDMELKHYEQAKAEIDQARALLEQDSDRQMVELEFGLHELTIKKATSGGQADTINQLENQLLEMFESLSDRHLRSSPRVVRMMLAAFGDEDVDVLRRGLKIMTLGDPNQEQRQSIGRAMAQWDALLSKTRNAPPGSLLETISRPVEKGATLLQSWLEFAESSKARELSEAIVLLLDKFGDTTLSKERLEEAAPGGGSGSGSIPAAPPSSAPAPAPQADQPAGADESPEPKAADDSTGLFDGLIEELSGATDEKSAETLKRRLKKKRFDAGTILGRSLSRSILDAFE